MSVAVNPKTHCINLTSHESLGFVNKRVSIIWRPVHNPAEYKRHTIAPQERLGHPKKHDAPYVDAYCSEKKTLENPRGMSRDWHWWDEYDRCGDLFAVCPYQPGDVLIGREAWALYQTINYIRRYDGAACYDPSDGLATYKVDGYENIDDLKTHIRLMSGCDLEAILVHGDTWRSAATMPSWAARHRHVVKSVSVKRCQDVTYSEMIDSGYGEPAVTEQGTERLVNVAYTFRKANEKAWDANLWLWRYEVGEVA